MKKEVVFELESMYRSPMKIYGYRFGSGERAACIVGAVHGTEVQQAHICAKLIERLSHMEEEGLLVEGKEILIIPVVNPYSMNINKRFWTMDNSDIERMMPGYTEGETTQRIAAKLFAECKEYTYGIQFTSFANQGEFIPHVRIFDTTYQSPVKARQFGLPYVIMRQPQPYETASLNYNWQIWNTEAYMIYMNAISSFDERAEKEATLALTSVLNFLGENGIIHIHNEAQEVKICRNEDMVTIQCSVGGYYKTKVYPGDTVRTGDLLAEIIEPYEGTVKQRLIAPTDGLVFFAHTDVLCNGSTMAVHILV